MASKPISKDAALYGLARPKKASGKEINASGTLSFTSNLSSLIAGSSSTNASRTSATRSRPKKEDIFATNNKGSRKRALRDLDDVDFTQKHSTSSEAIDEATMKRQKRKMEEKARLYAAMKRGEVEDLDEKHMVDFDRKWAEEQERGDEDKEESSDYGSDSEPEELVEFEDEFGRTRKGTRFQAAKMEQRKKMLAADTPDRFTARPAAPTNLIYGDVIQTEAWNPDRDVAEKMAKLVEERDREDTPPEAHYDASKEVRTKGTGFFKFSGDNAERAKQMEALEKERDETERARLERSKRTEERKKEVEERKQAILEKRNKAKADRFLSGLDLKPDGE